MRLKWQIHSYQMVADKLLCFQDYFEAMNTDQNSETDKQVLQILSCVVEEKPKPHQQLQILDFIIDSFYQHSRGAGYAGAFKPKFVIPCNNFVRPRVFVREPMDYAQSAMEQLINEARMSPEEREQFEQAQSEQEQEPVKNEHPLEGFLPSKNPNLPDKMFGSMEDLRKSRP